MNFFSAIFDSFQIEPSCVSNLSFLAFLSLLSLSHNILSFNFVPLSSISHLLLSCLVSFCLFKFPFFLSLLFSLSFFLNAIILIQSVSAHLMLSLSLIQYFSPSELAFFLSLLFINKFLPSCSNAFNFSSFQFLSLSFFNFFSLSSEQVWHVLNQIR